MSPEDRVHACLDGDLPRAALLPEERAQLDALEAVIDAAAEQLRSRATPDLVPAVMRALPVIPPSTHRRPSVGAMLRRAAAWVWAPHEVTIRPAYGFAGAFAALLLLLRLPVTSPEASDSIAAASDASDPVFVQFRLDAPSASHVALAGDFTDWQPQYELRETAPGVWSVLVPLVPGVHDYTFVVDGEQWVADPHAPHVADSFGGVNSRIFLVPPEHGA